MTGFLRLRQVCLAVNELHVTETALSSVLGIRVCNRSPTIGRFGLENAVFAVNGSFIELLAPVRAGTTVSRFLSKGEERGAYLVAFDCDNLEHQLEIAQRAGAIPIQRTTVGGAELFQLDPRDTGAAMIEVDRHTGGEDRWGAFEWGGTDWQSFVDTDTTADILGICIQGEGAHSVLQRWGQVLGAAVTTTVFGDVQMGLDYGYVLSRQSDAKARVAALAVFVRDVPSVLTAARAQAWPVSGHSFLAAGVWFELQPLS